MLTERDITMTLDGLAGSLDRLTSQLCDLDPEQRRVVLLRLRRIAADLGAINDHFDREEWLESRKRQESDRQS